MYLAKIELQGFKSFAQKTVLGFPEFSYKDKKADSITAIVGPNGSGKSNISDAIRWVLGEQSVKLLRGKKADDVIFAGSESKARLGFAEVSLYLNNEDQKAPIDYTEIVITRRVYRDGEGEYLINKNKVRLFDILMLLAKANFGQKSYSIIGQGMVDQIINISPWERKDFFDEATGVKQYQIKRDQSVSRLTRSKDNLEQTNKILAELEPRLRLLIRQINKLEKRKELEKQLKILQEKYYANLWQGMKLEKTIQQENFGIKDALKKDLESQLEVIQEKLAKLARAESRKDIFTNLQKEYNKLVAEKNDILKELTMIKGKMNLEYVKVGKQNLSWLEDKKEETASRIKEIQDSLDNVKSLLMQKSQLLKEEEDNILKLNRELSVLQNNLIAAQDDLARLKSGRSSSNHEAVKAILRQKEYIKGIYGAVSELGKVDERYQMALSVVAGGQLNAVVVQNEEVAVRGIAYLKEHKLGTVTFLPLNKLKTRLYNVSKEILAQKGAIARAIDLVVFDSKYAKAFEYVLGSTLVFDSLENAKSLVGQRHRIVTLDGDVIESSGAMRGGFRFKGLLRWVFNGQQKQASTQEEKLQEIALLKSKIEDKYKQKESAIEKSSNLKVDLQVSETKSKGLLNDMESLEKDLEKIENDLAEQQISPDDQDRYLKNLGCRRKEVEGNLTKIESKVAEVKKRIDSFNLEEEKKKVEVFRLQDEMQSQQIKLNEVVREVNAINVSLARVETKQEELEKEVAQEMGTEIKLDKLVGEVAINVDQLWFEISKFKKSLELIGGIDPEIVDEHKEVSERYEFLSGQVQDLEKAIVDLEKIINELDQVIEKQFNVSFKQINKSFENYFKKIFQGGKAKLTILQKEAPKQAGNIAEEQECQETGEDLVEDVPDFTKTGVDIYVSPPNKKLNTISALSGGERTMTSLALLCAIIDSNPSPFVVMDEVDAALDEANSERFSQILQELSYKTQFIVITHNRVIMHVADVLYGVAMGDNGVSKTLSLDLKEAEKIKVEA